MTRAPFNIVPVPNLLDAPRTPGAPPWKLFGAAVIPGYLAPDETAGAVLLREDATAAPHALRQLFGPVLGGNVYRFTCCAKAGARHWIALDLWDHGAGQSGGSAWFDLASGQPGAVRSRGDGAARLSSRMEALGGGWYRCDLVAQVSLGASTGMYTAQIGLAAHDAGWDYPGDAASGAQIWAPAIHHQPLSNLLQAADTPGAPPWVLAHAAILDHVPAPPDGASGGAPGGVPGGAPGAVLLRESATEGEHVLRQNVPHVVGGPAYALSCFCRAAGRDWVRLILCDPAPDGAVAHAWFDLMRGVTGSVGWQRGVGAALHGTIDPVGNGWYRCALTGAAQTRRPGGTLIAQIQLGLGDGVDSYGGDGVAGVRLWRLVLRQHAPQATRPQPLVPVLASAAPMAEAPGTETPPAWFDPADVSDQKLALLGAFLAARPPATQGVRLPSYAMEKRARANRAGPDGARKSTAAPVPFGQVFERDALRDFAARHAIRILPTTRADIAPGHAAFDAANTALAEAADETGAFCRDFLHALRPIIGATDIARRLRASVFTDHAITAVAHLRLDLGWQRLTARIAARAGAVEASDLSLLAILRKIKTGLPAHAAKLYLACDEATLPFGKARINEAAAQDLGMALLWQSDLLRAAERRALSRWDRALLDFEIARAAPVFIGHSRASFARLVTLERHASDGAPVRGHYIYNVTGPGLGERADNGTQVAPDLIVRT